MFRLGPVLLASALAVAAATAQDPTPDPAGLRPRLETIFERPAGTPIGDAQKQALRTLVEQHADRDLGAFGYVRALDAYLQRDYPAAIAASEQFFAEHDVVPIAEHATMLGRIALMGMMQADGAEARARHATRCVRLYDDGTMLLRALPQAMQGLDVDGQRSLRLAVARAVLDGGRPAEAQDELLAKLYGGGPATAAAPASTVIPAARIQATPAQPGAREAAAKAEQTRAGLTGNAAPALAATHVIGGAADLSLASLRGKVVVLDFTATWCGPCRKIIPEMIAMQDAHPDDLQVLAVTRLYGYGTEFDADGKAQTVRDLDRDAEIAVNERFREHFAIDYPVVFVEQATMRDGYGVQGIPTVFVIGKDGKVVGHAVGAGDAAHAEVERMVAQALVAR